MMSLNGMTGAYDQSLESSQSDWSTKFWSKIMASPTKNLMK